MQLKVTNELKIDDFTYLTPNSILNVEFAVYEISSKETKPQMAIITPNKDCEECLLEIIHKKDMEKSRIMIIAKTSYNQYVCLLNNALNSISLYRKD